MVSKLVAVDGGLHLPTAVRNQLSADLVADMSAYVDDAETAAGAAATSASTASTASATAVAAAATATAPTDTTVAGFINNPASLTYDALTDFLGDSSVTKRAISMNALPKPASGVIGSNGTSFTQDAATIYNGKQYVVYWSNTLTPIVAYRTINGSGTWSWYDLSAVSGNPLASPGALDSHNSLTIAIDSLGYIHIWGNQHNNTLRYVKSTAPDSIAAFATASMVGTNETSMSYPTPVKTPDGTLWFTYREGGSSNGDQYLNRYNTGTSTWSRIGKIFDGITSTESAYLNHIAPGPDNSFHIFFCWRSSTTADSNNDLGYVKILSNGTGKKANGTTQTVPVTHANMDKILDTAGTGSGMINQMGADLDSDGLPHTVTWLYDGSGNTQMYHYWWNGTAWASAQLTNLATRIDLTGTLLQPSLSRAQVVCPAQGGTYVIYRCNYEGKSGSIRAIDATPGKTPFEFKLLDIETYDWEPNYDTVALKTRNELNMLVIPLAANNSSTTSVPWNNTDNWNFQTPLMVSIDLYRMQDFAKGEVVLPTYQLIWDHIGPTAGQTITSATPADITFGAGTYYYDDNDLLMCRYTVRMAASAATTTTVNLRMNQEYPTTSTVLSGTTALTTTTASTYFRTPWMPVQSSAVAGVRLFLTLYAMRTGSGAATVSAASLQLAKISGLT